MFLIVGANGQLGQELMSRLGDKAKGVDRDVLDITDAEAVKKMVGELKPEVIINCAAYTAVDKAEADVDLARKINADGVYNLASCGTKLIHISTDYVFDGKNCVPYTEEDKPNPQSVYGITKLEGEQKALACNKNVIVIRTAWLYSAYGNNFVKTMRRLGAEREVLGVVFDQVGTPTFAGDLAQAIVDILPQMNEENAGIYHFSNEGVCSWYDFAVEIMAQSGLNCKVNPIESKEYPTPAVRPSFSVLNKAKIKKVFGVKVPYWKESLSKCLKQF